MAKSSDNNDPNSRQESHPDFSTPLPREKLNKNLQKIVDEEDTKWWDRINEGTAADSTGTSFRYAAYATRIRTILLSAHRYVAYTSDIGESFRPVAHPWLVRGAYGVSWAYILGDVGYEGYKAYLRNQRILNPLSAPHKDVPEPENSRPLTTSAPTAILSSQPLTIPLIEDYRVIMAQRATFQSIASMGLPAFTIHSIVRYSGRAMKSVKNVKLRTWGPIGLGLSAVPFLPYLFDKPVEEGIEWLFYNGARAWGGEDAVRGRSSTGRSEALLKESREERKKEKEL
ncbi:MAG: hypothetical protein M1834_000063 [Cirrosporium novae-zelandiae]|nr:MAG: hypothetical protein M1834_000063 [Cirrosporium novae-zelandiae]